MNLFAKKARMSSQKVNKVNMDSQESYAHGIITRNDLNRRTAPDVCM